jgi:hypothetical protein
VLLPTLLVFILFYFIFFLLILFLSLNFLLIFLQYLSSLFWQNKYIKADHCDRAL